MKLIFKDIFITVLTAKETASQRSLKLWTLISAMNNLLTVWIQTIIVSGLFLILRTIFYIMFPTSGEYYIKIESNGKAKVSL